MTRWKTSLYLLEDLGNLRYPSCLLFNLLPTTSTAASLYWEFTQYFGTGHMIKMSNVLSDKFQEYSKNCPVPTVCHFYFVCIIFLFLIF